jgi:hypothetical protein
MDPRGDLYMLEKRKTLILQAIETGFFKRPTRSLYRILQIVILNSCGYSVSLRAPLEKLTE